MFRLATLIVIFSLAGCAETRAFEIAGAEYRFNDNDGRCQFEDLSAKRAIDLVIPYPCSVHRDPDGEVRIVEVSGSKLVVVESSIPDPDFPADCRTSLQALRITGDSLEASSYSDTVAACPPFQWDRKVFTGLFND